MHIPIVIFVLCRLVLTEYSLSESYLLVCSISGHNLTSCFSVPILADYLADVVVTPDRSTLYVLNIAGNLTTCSVNGQNLTCGTPFQLSKGFGGTLNMALSPDGSTLYVVNYEFSFVQVCEISGQTSHCGAPTGNQLQGPAGITISPNGSVAYITNFNGNSIYYCDISGQNLTCGTPISDPTFNRPQGVAVSPDGSTLYVANNLMGRISICKITSSISLDCGVSPAVFDYPTAITVSPDGSVVYVTGVGPRIGQSSVTICSISAGNFTDCVITTNATVADIESFGIAVY